MARVVSKLRDRTQQGSAASTVSFTASSWNQICQAKRIRIRRAGGVGEFAIVIPYVLDEKLVAIREAGK